MYLRKLLTSMICILSVLISTSSTVLAAEFDPSAYSSITMETNLLPEGVKESRDYVSAIARRGVFFAAADLIISNNDGDIDVSGHAYMMEPVDEIYMTIYLEMYVETEDGDGDWEHVDMFEFEFYAEDYPDGELTSESVEFTLTGYPTGEYYRLRGAYAAVKDGVIEGFGPVTDGILIQ